MKSGRQKKSLDRFIYESMGEKQYLISLKDIKNFWMEQRLKENS